MNTSSIAPAQVQSVRLIDLRLDGGTQSRAGIDPAVVERYAETVDELPPVDVFHDGESYWLADGFHRVAALEQVGRDLFNARVHQGTQRDAILHACGANAVHGLPRTHADARRAVERLLGDEEWRTKSDRWIAERCRVSHSWVGRIRAELGAHADVRQVERGGVTFGQRANKERGPVGGHLDSESRCEQPEPDNVVRTPVEHEHRGAPLTAEQRAAMVDLARAGWSRAHIAERFRVAPMEVDQVLRAASEVVHPEEDRSEVDPQLVDDADDTTAPSSPPSSARDIAEDQWWTPPALARAMVELAGVQPGETVLEPSAGSGAIVSALLEAGALVEAHEMDPRWAQRLRERWATGGPESTCPVDVYEGDYLAAEAVGASAGRWPYPRAVINPPYKDGLDGRFLARVLDEAEVVVALLRVNVLCGQARYRDVWARHGGRCRSIHPLVIRPDFTGGDRGTEGSGAKSDFVVLVFGGEDLGEAAPVRHLVDRFGGEA